MEKETETTCVVTDCLGRDTASSSLLGFVLPNKVEYSLENVNTRCTLGDPRDRRDKSSNTPLSREKRHLHAKDGLPFDRDTPLSGKSRTDGLHTGDTGCDLGPIKEE